MRKIGKAAFAGAAAIAVATIGVLVGNPIVARGQPVGVNPEGAPGAGPKGLPADIEAKFKNFKQPDVVAARLKLLQAKMKPEYRFKIGRTSVLERPGPPLRGFKSGQGRQLVVKPPERHQAAMAMMVIPPSLDYVAQGRVTPAKGQWCGDCWAFAAAAICESAYIKQHTDAWPDFSEQCLLDCVGNTCDCRGGYYDIAVEFVVKSGIMDEQAYAYTGWLGTCAAGQQMVRSGATWGYVDVTNPFGVPTDAALKLALLEHGPLAVGISWSELADAYQSGVLNNCAEAAGPADHAVTLVGWDDSLRAWRIKNSEGPGWGDQGFAWVEYGCANIGTMAVWVEMQ
jgi:hypothetical protein